MEKLYAKNVIALVINLYIVFRARHNIYINIIFKIIMSCPYCNKKLFSYLFKVIPNSEIPKILEKHKEVNV